MGNGNGLRLRDCGPDQDARAVVPKSLGLGLAFSGVEEANPHWDGLTDTQLLLRSSEERLLVAACSCDLRHQQHVEVLRHLLHSARWSWHGLCVQLVRPEAAAPAAAQRRFAEDCLALSTWRHVRHVGHA